MKLERFLIPHTNINSKWIKDQMLRPETIIFLEENIGSQFIHLIRTDSNAFVFMA